MPSQRLRLEESGYSEAIAYDFDLAVMQLASTIERKAQETEQVPVADNREKPPDGFHFEQKPRYELRDLLVERPATTGDDAGDVDTELFAHLPTAHL